MTVIKGVDRRRFLLGMGSAVLSTTLLSSCGRNQTQWLISTATHDNGEHFAVAISPEGTLIAQVPLPAKGLDVLALPNKPGHALIFTQQSNGRALEVNFIDERIEKSISSDSDTHLCGYGALSNNGQLLFTTENHSTSQNGLIVVRETQNYTVLHRFESGGIGPREIKVLPNTQKIAVANSGISSHFAGTEKTLPPNLIKSNLTYLNAETGHITGQFTAPDHRQSIQHLDVSESEKVFIGMHYYGNKKKRLPLIYSHQGNEMLKACSATQEQLERINQDTASIKVQNNLLAVTCPKGKCITFLNAESLKVIEQQPYEGAAGLALVNNKLIASNEKGTLRFYNSRVNLQHAEEQSLASLHFNHYMTAIYSA